MFLTILHIFVSSSPPQKMFHLTLACGVSLTISNIPLHLVVITLQRFRLHISFLVFLYWEAHEIQQSAALMQIYSSN